MTKRANPRIKRSRLLFVVLALAALFVLVFVISFFSSFSSKVAVIPFKGTIEDSSYVGSVSSSEIISFLEEANNDPRVKSILLEINSPGGSVVETKQIAYYIRDEVDKPVVAWIGDIGASGGYYVAASCDSIVADPDSLTGSIGVIGMFFSVSGFLQEYGIDVNILKEGEYKASGSLFEGLRPEDVELWQPILSQAFANFKYDLLLFRQGKLSSSSLEEVADGRVLTGFQAYSLGLIDVLGTKRDALRLAGELGGIKGEPKVVVLERSQMSLSSLFFSAGSSFGKGLREKAYSSQGIKLV